MWDTEIFKANRAAIASNALVVEMTPAWVLMTPEFAKALLDHTDQINISRGIEGVPPVNRSLKRTHLDKLKDDLTYNRFLLNGHSIVLGTEGEVKDGQHRLTACVQTGVSFYTILLSNLPDESMKTIDSQATRKSGEQLTLAGLKYGPTLASAARAMVYLARMPRSMGKVAISHSAVDDVLLANPGLIDFTNSIVNRAARIIGVPGSSLVALLYIGSCIQGRKEQAEKFLSALETGMPAYTDCAAHAVREYFVKSAMRKEALKKEDKLRALAHAWNAFIIEKPVKQMRTPDHLVVYGWDEDVCFGRAVSI